MDKKITIIHDALVVAGGAERVALSLSQVFPEAPIYTSAYLSEKTFYGLKSKKINTLPGASLVHNENQFKRLFPLWFFGFHTLDLSAYKIILSSSTYAAKFVKTKKNSIHICYMHSPFRFLWKRDSYSPDSVPFNKPITWLIDRLIPILRKIDLHYTRQITQIIANSQHMSDFIKQVYKRDAIIIYPPVDVNQYHVSTTRKDYYLFVGRLLSYKRADLAIMACQKSDRKLVIIGDGPEIENLKKISGPKTMFLGKVSDEELKQHYSEAKGLIFPGIEDFGLTPVEAQASGCPVIAMKDGGALETVVEGETGVFFECQTVDALVTALSKFETIDFEADRIRQNALKFDLSVFSSKMIALVEGYLTQTN
jgi:glycosyltransferase involved in cell wall biosynthesis